MADVLALAVVHNPGVFTNRELDILSETCADLRSAVRQPWVWRERCVNAGLVEIHKGLFPDPNWQMLYRTQKYSNFGSVSVRTEPCTFRLNLPPTDYSEWLDVVTAATATFLGRRVHIQHLHLNGAPGRPCARGDCFQSVTAADCACTGSCYFQETSGDFWSIDFEFESARLHLDLPRGRFATLGQVVDAAAARLGLPTGEEISMSGQRSARNLAMLEDLRVAGGECFRLSLCSGGIRLERRAWSPWTARLSRRPPR